MLLWVWFFIPAFYTGYFIVSVGAMNGVSPVCRVSEIPLISSW